MFQPKCSIVMLSYNQLEYTKQCLESIREYTKDVSYEIIMVDNASHTETVEYLETVQDIQLIKNSVNMGFAGGCNQGIQAAKGEYILLLNNDTVVTPKWLSNMVQLLDENDDIAMVGPLTNATVGKQMIEVPYGDDLEQMQEFARKLSKSKEKPWRTLRLVAFCALIRREVLEEIGLLDTRFLVGNYEDDDFNLRALQTGKKAYICRNSFIHHFMNISFKQKNIEREKIMMENKIRLEDKWQNLNWNHYAVFNSFMLQTILEREGKRILHLGCGLGALEIELKDKDSSYQVTGVDAHPIRSKIAKEFLDIVIPYDEKKEFLKKVSGKYDVIIIEEMIERLGVDFLKEISSLLEKDGILILRIFNDLHITTLERLMTGKVEGRLLCASSEIFKYYYDVNVEEEFKKFGFEIVEKKEIKKSFTNLQQDIYEATREFCADEKEPMIYNRIYCLKAK